MSDLKPCPFCGGEAEMLTAESMHGGYMFGIMCNDCRSRGDVYDTEAEAIAAWNTRADYHGYEQSAIEAWESVKAWNSRAAKPCYAADANYERCKYGVNRGWCDDAPFLVWDDTGHLFITMGGLKTWDVTDDARKWSAAHGTLTAEQVREAIKANAYPETSTTFEFGSSSWQEIADELNSRAERTCKNKNKSVTSFWCSKCDAATSDGFADVGGKLARFNYCPNCGRKCI